MATASSPALGEINGRKVFVASQERGVMGGSLGEMHANKIVKAMHMAIKYGCPFIASTTPAARASRKASIRLGGYAKIFDANCEASGVIPQLSVIMGPCAGGAVYSPALTDFVFMTENSYMFITGPEVVKAVMQENVSFDELGGGLDAHSKESGVCHFLSKDDAECLLACATCSPICPPTTRTTRPTCRRSTTPTALPGTGGPSCPRSDKPYDVRQVIHTSWTMAASSKCMNCGPRTWSSALLGSTAT
jgi:acetyl-CoA carboxylase carboxyltransferase component